METLKEIQGKIKLRYERSKMTEAQKKQEALHGVLSAQKTTQRALTPESVFVPPEGNLAAHVAIVVWSPDGKLQIEDETTKPFEHLVTNLGNVGIEYAETWRTSIKKFTREYKPHSTNWADVDFLHRELDVIKPRVVLVCGERCMGVLIGSGLNLVSNHGHIHTQRRSGSIRSYVATFDPTQLSESKNMQTMFAVACDKAAKMSQHIL